MAALWTTLAVFVFLGIPTGAVEDNLSMSPMSGSYLELLESLKDETAKNGGQIDRDALLEKSRRLRKLVGWKAQGKAAVVLGHIMEHIGTDPSMLEYRKLLDVMQENVFKNAESIRYNPRAIVLNEARMHMGKMASKGTIDIDGRTMQVEALDDNGAIFTVSNFLSEAETGALLNTHNSMMEGTAHQPLVCDKSQQIFGEDIDEAKYIDGFYCMRFEDFSELRVPLSWINITTFYAEERRLVEQVHQRIEKLTSLDTLNGHVTRIMTYNEDSTMATEKARTDCKPGGKFFPRKLHAATVNIYLNDDFEGGNEEFPGLGGQDYDVIVTPKRGMLMLQFNFDGQECGLKMARQEHVVTQGTKAVLRKLYDNVKDETLSYRPFVALPPGSSETGRQPYQPAIVCEDDDCRYFIDAPKKLLAATSENWQFGTPHLTDKELEEVRDMASKEGWEGDWEGPVAKKTDDSHSHTEL
eukprot:m.47259 g.47259  ORF g.47259 m.47259 type:complete len:469 (+) comp10471_c1_seq3:115-1521(+)